MTAFRGFLGAVTAGIALVLPAPTPASAAPTGYGDCEIEVFQPAGTGRGGDGLVVTTIRNRGNQPFSAVSVELWEGRTRSAQVTAAPLRPGGSTVARLPVRADTTGAYVVVRYEAEGTPHEIAVPLPQPAVAAPAGDDSGAWRAWLAPILSFAGALLAVLLGHVTAVRRDRSRMTAEARWKGVDRDSPAYREFLDYWERSTSASHLETAFGQLRSRASVPARVEEEYRRTLEVLRADTSTGQAKRDAAERLYDAVDGLTIH